MDGGERRSSATEPIYAALVREFGDVLAQNCADGLGAEAAAPDGGAQVSVDGVATAK